MTVNKKKDEMNFIKITEIFTGKDPKNLEIFLHIWAVRTNPAAPPVQTLHIPSSTRLFSAPGLSHLLQVLSVYLGLWAMTDYPSGVTQRVLFGVFGVF